MADTIPVAQLRAFVERIERIEADIKDLNGDKSEVYKELRGCGFDVKAVRAVVAKRKLDTADREERDAMFDLYWSALNGEDRARAHAREIIEEFPPHDPETGEVVDEMDRATEGSLETGSEAAENARKATSDVNRFKARAETGSVSHAGAGESPATNSSQVATVNSGHAPTDHAARSGDKSAASIPQPVTHSDDLEIPAFLRRSDGYAARSGRTAA